MNADDIAQVMDIERESFPSMWPQTAYRRELQNKVARYFVINELRDEPAAEGAASPGLWSAIRRIVGSDGDAAAERVLGFIGIWLLVGEAHIVTVAVRDEYRRIGIGERLVIAAIETALEYDQEVLTLEVRRSNDAAQLLYVKYGFDRVGLRKRYYTDNNEDAVLMTTPDIGSGGFLTLFDALKQQHRAKNPDLWS
ncbi:MAG: ribosomal protein S18-alanine N-acetyltransferase [Dehalococcoidia bacterium]